MPAAPLECGTGYTQRRAGHAWVAARDVSIDEGGGAESRGGEEGGGGQGTESDGEKMELPKHSVSTWIPDPQICTCRSLASLSDFETSSSCAVSGAYTLRRIQRPSRMHDKT
ncbi:hypothetical protein IAS59_004053 [Cryptococcus gattii]